MTHSNSYKEEQDIATACEVLLIQNAIALWNYLYVSNLLVNIADLDERRLMTLAISRGSMACCQHINLHGEYDFTRISANDSPFDIDKIIGLKVA